jgi:ubiquinone/menaquinone biosynthesis C-methylase UbiE
LSHAGTEDKFVKTLFPSDMEGIEVLDIGHGYGETALYIRTRTYKGGWCKLTGIEVFRDYHELQQRMGIYDTLTLGNALEMPYPDKAFNISIGQHVIEHFSKNEGVKMLSETERVTRNRIIICTPHGYTESGPLDDNVHNYHLSGWYPEDFHRLGYKTRIVTKNVNSRLIVAFAKLLFWLKGKRWDNEVLVAWKDLEAFP